MSTTTPVSHEHITALTQLAWEMVKAEPNSPFTQRLRSLMLDILFDAHEKEVTQREPEDHSFVP